MLVRDLGDRYQIVLQPDHGEVAGQLAAAWRSSGLSAGVREGLLLAAARHDDGWAVWERHPRLDDEGRPQIFFRVPLTSLLSSYRAAAEVLAAESPAAALLVSMHVSGLQRNRYGVMDAGEPKPLDALRSPIREFVLGEESRQAALAAELGWDETERWWAYRLLQVYDTLSLHLGLSDLVAGEAYTLTPAPERLSPPRGGGPDRGQAITFSPTGAPWTVRCAPFPFARSPAQVRMRCRFLLKRSWRDEAEFRVDFAAAREEEVLIGLVA